MLKAYKYTKILAIIMPILLAVICLVLVVRNDNQASMPIPMNLTFTGEFSYDGENWYPYNEDSDMSALDGDVTVKGHFDVDISEEAILILICSIGFGVSLIVQAATEPKAWIASYADGRTSGLR